MFRSINTKNIERILASMKETMPVNRDLKQKLRKEFQGRVAKPDRRRPWAYIATAAVLCLAIIIWPFIDMIVNDSPQQIQNNEPGGAAVDNVTDSNISDKRALAAELNVVQQISFVDIGEGQNTAPSAWGQLLYIPVFGNGIYRVDMVSSTPVDKGMVKVVDAPNIVFVSASHDGNRLAYTTDEGIYVYDLNSGNTTAIAQNTDTVYYEEPSWAPDDSHLLLTKKTVTWKEHGFDVKTLEIYKASLDGKEMSKVTDGSYASYAPDGSYIVFERDNKIIKLDTATDKSEQVIGEGRFPSLSPDGLSIAFVKTSSDKKELKPNAYVQEDIDDVYIADMADPSSAKKVTANYPLKSISEQSWLSSLKSTDKPQTLLYTGAYSYYNPLWAGDSQTLYVLKSSAQSSGIRLMRIALSTATLQPEEIVEGWMQAVVNRDDDYAKKLMKAPPDILTISNPHPVGYAIDGTGEEDGKVYVDARQYLAYTANPFLQMLKQRFYLDDTGSGYVIAEIKELGHVQIYEKNGGVYKQEGEHQQNLFTLKDVQAHNKSATRISSLAYDEKGDRIFIAVQQKEGIGIMAYDVRHKTFVDITTVKGNDVVAVDISLSGNVQYLAMNYGDTTFPHVLIYDMRNKQNISAEGMNNASGAFWAGNMLVFNASYDGGSIRWQLEPSTSKRELWSDYSDQ